MSTVTVLKRKPPAAVARRCHIYLSGAMRGHPDENRELFSKYAAQLRAAGNVVFDPTEQNVADVREAFRRDTDWICTRANKIYMLPGWHTSRGARAEWSLAQALDDVEIVYL
jgi:hypothetical protein